MKRWLTMGCGLLLTSVLIGSAAPGSQNASSLSNRFKQMGGDQAAAETLIKQLGAENQSVPGWLSDMLPGGSPEIGGLRRSGAADAYGYTWKDSDEVGGPAYSWVNVADYGTPLTLTGDAGTVIVTLPFSFPYYTGNFSSVKISTDGYLTFNTSESNSYFNATIPTGGTPNNIICPFWDDLNATGTGVVKYIADGTSRFIITYENMIHYGAAGAFATFQVILNADGSILFQYNTMNLSAANLASGTVGIEFGSTTVAPLTGQLVEYNTASTSVAAGKSILFSRPTSDVAGPYVAHTAIASSENVGPFTINATMADYMSGMASGALNYRINGGSWNTVPMVLGAAPNYSCTLPAQVLGSTVDYYLTATDVAGNSSRLPADSATNFTFVVQDYTQPPQTVVASEDQIARVVITWTAPAWAHSPVAEAAAEPQLDEFLSQYSDKAEAYRQYEAAHASWMQQMEGGADRSFTTYRIYRDGTLLSSTTSLTYTDATAVIGTTYTYGVSAVFTAGESAIATDTGTAANYPTQGGPDSFGYTWINSLNPAGTPINWIDIAATGTELTTFTDDNYTAGINMGINFPFYNAMKSRVFLTSNGVLCFDSLTTSYAANTAIPTAGLPNNSIFMYWDDLAYTAGTSHAYYQADAANGRFIYQLTNVRKYSAYSPLISVQAILYASGDILLQYLNVDETAAAIADQAIGLENSTGTVGLQVRYGNGTTILGGSLVDNMTVFIDRPAGDVVGPVIAHTPMADTEQITGNYTVTANITDQDSQVAGATLYYNVNGGSFTSVAMTGTAPVFTAQIPAQPALSVVGYYIVATDLAVPANSTTSSTWTFDILDYTWPPRNLVASEGQYNGVNLTWGVAANPNLESFEAGLPSTWTTYNVDADTYSWTTYAVTGAPDGAYAAGIHWNSDVNDDWLVTNARTATATSSISYQVRNGSTSYQEVFEVYAWTGATVPTAAEILATGTQLAAITLPASDINWYSYTHSLAAFDGQPVYIAWRCISEDALYLYLDAVTFGNLAPVALLAENHQPHAENPTVAELSAKGINRSEAVAIANASGDAGRAFQAYNIYRDGSVVGTSTSLSYVDVPPAANTNYTYHVTALYDAGESDASNTDQGNYTVRPTAGGPDANGYSWVNSLDANGPEYNWVDISATGTLATLPYYYSTTGAINLGFTFPFYQNGYSSVYLNALGELTFGTSGYSTVNTTLPSAGTPNNQIAVLWDYFNISQASYTGSVHYLADSENQRFIVQYHLVANGGTVFYDFQTILTPDGGVMVQFQNVDEANVAGSTTGLENSGGTVGITAQFNGIGSLVADNMAIQFIPPAGDWLPPVITHTALVNTEDAVNPYLVNASIVDADNQVEAATLYYKVGAGAFTPVTMTAGAAPLWTGSIPAQVAGSDLQYYITATDNSVNHNLATSPTWSFSVVDYTLAPSNLVATDGNYGEVALTWTAPAWMLSELAAMPEPRIEDFAGSKEAADAAFQAAHAAWQARLNADRSFLNYNIIRDGAPVGTSLTTSYIDIPPVAGQTYTYQVTASFSVGQSNGSNTDTGFYLARPTSGGVVTDYTWMNSDDPSGVVDYVWTDIAGVPNAVELGDMDDDACRGPLALGFSFPFYGENKLQVYVNSNGTLSFAPDSSFSNVAIPDTTNPDGFIAAFWDDQNPTSLGTVWTLADAANQTFTVQWTGIPHYGATLPYTYQAVLHADGKIFIYYNDMQGIRNSAAVGIENATGTAGLQVNLNDIGGRIGNGVAVRIKPFAPCGQPGSVDVTLSGGNANISWTAVDGATSYKVFGSSDGYTGFSQIGTSSTTSYTDTGAQAAGRKFYQIVAVCD